MKRKSGTSYRLCPYCNRMVDVNKNHDCQAKREHFNHRHEAYAKREKEVDRPLHTKRWAYFRRSVITADGGYCQRCWRKYGIKTYDHLEVHHIKPRIKYPGLIYDKSNCVTLCHSCNAQLGLSGIDFKWSPNDRKFSGIHYGFAL